MTNSLSDSHLSASSYASPSPSPSPSPSLSTTPDPSIRRFSQIKRKPAPIVPTRYTASELQDPLSPIWEMGNKLKPSPDITRSQTPAEDTRDFWNSLTNFDSESEEKSSPPKVPRGRPRANTVPSRRFSKLVRVPPPAVDLDLLESARRLGALRSVSAPLEHTLIQVSATVHVVANEDGGAYLAPPEPQYVGESDDDNTAAASLHPPPRLMKSRSSRSFRKSTLSFIQKRKSHISVTSISPPVTSPRKYSVVSMASTNNASMISLSAFPQPPGSVPPVPVMPSLESLETPKPEMQTPRSFILHADPPLQPSDAGSVQAKSDTDADPGRPAVVEAASSSSSANASKSERPVASTSAVKRPPPIIIEHTDGPREPHFDFGEPPEFDGFDETRLPTQLQLEEAAALPVISESGVRIPFGNIWQDQKTIVCFIRHFWCPLCQDYMFSISRNVSPEVLSEAGIQLVIVSNGSHDMIKSYRRIFRTPFALYTDPTHKVYNALGMTLQTLEKGPRGNYVRHGMMSGIGMVVVNAVKVGMPVWKEGGDISQLGGEFILGPGLTCSWVHRMRYTRSHVPILQVIEAAGVDMYTPLHRALSSTGGSFLGMSSEEETKWMERRRKVLKKLKGKKMSRRGGTQWMETASTTTTATGSNSSSSPVGSKRSSKRSSAGSEPATAAAATASLCSWNPEVEDAINVGLTGEEDAIIEEVEEEEAAEAEMERERDAVVSGAGEDVSEVRSEVAQLDDTKSEILSDTKSEYTDSFVSQDPSELESSATDVESTAAAHSPVQVSFDHVDVHFDRKSRVDERTIGSRSSFSSVGSGYDIVADAHDVYFGGDDKGAIRMRSACISESSIESMG